MTSECCRTNQSGGEKKKSDEQPLDGEENLILVGRIWSWGDGERP